MMKAKKKKGKMKMERQLMSKATKKPIFGKDYMP